jgi:uncharacterized lipoprotein YddW (UPF0748 family)
MRARRWPRLVFALALALMGPNPRTSAADTAPAATPRAEMRGLWVVRTGLVSPADVDRVVERAAQAGFNALFVQVRGRGDAFYDTRLAPRSPLLERQPPDFDPLARLIERARLHGLGVHAWINILLTAGFGTPLPAGHVLAEHPEWAMVPRTAALAALRVPRKGLLWLIRRHADPDPDVEGFYLAPAAAGVGAHLEAVTRELVRGYPLDGLHFDFVRYPGREFDYGPAALAAFHGEAGAPALRRALASPGAYAEARRAALSALTTRLAGAAREERPGLTVSAAVVPDEAVALTQKYQDWPQWLARGVLDAVCPMAYSPDPRVFRQQVERAQALAAGRRPVWAGVGAYKLDLEGIVRHIRVARASGASGVVLFSQESLRPGDLASLRAQAFPTPSATAPRPPAGPGTWRTRER